MDKACNDIKVRVDEKANLTTFVVPQNVSVEKIISTLETYYSKSPTLHSLWDFSRTDPSNLKTEDLEQILSVAQEKALTREGGKTAFVAFSDLSYGIGRMYEILTEIYGHPVAHMVFKSHPEALDWLIAGEEHN